MTEYGWSDAQHAENEAFMAERNERPLCNLCGGALDKDHDFIKDGGIICPSCGEMVCKVCSDVMPEGEEDRRYQNHKVLINYNDLCHKKLHPDWWDRKTMMPIRKEEI